MDPLRQAFKARENQTFYSPIPQKYEKIFKTKRYDLEHFGMSFFQRMVCFSICFITGVLFLLYSMFKMPTAVISPSGFVLPYALSNLLFLSMFGFLLGFKTHFSGLFFGKNSAYCVSFVVSTLLTLYIVLRYNSYLLNLTFCFIQVASFVMLLLSFVPGGTAGASNVVGMLFKK